MRVEAALVSLLSVDDRLLAVAMARLIPQCALPQFKCDSTLSCFLLRWRRPHGRAFEMVMCELRRRMLGVAPSAKRVDWDTCVLYCGDDAPVPLIVPVASGSYGGTS